MNHWLLKTEPSTYAYGDLERDKRCIWDGVTNALALKHLRSMKKGDFAFIYHTGDEKQIVGIAKIVSDPYPDPAQPKDTRRVVMDLAPQKRLTRPVSLAEIKARQEFSEWELVRISRLSVLPVHETLWSLLCECAQ